MAVNSDHSPPAPVSPPASLLARRSPRSSTRRRPEARPAVVRSPPRIPSYLNAREDELDILVCEEAHRIRRHSWNRWTKQKAEDPERPQIDELADVAIYLIRIADVLGVDLGEAVRRKIDENERRFPVERVRGRATLPDPPAGDPRR